jgi:hypothetical protein
MSARRPALALALLILFGIGGVAAPLAHGMEHAQQTEHAGAPALAKTDAEHDFCLCSATLTALPASYQSVSPAQEHPAWTPAPPRAAAERAPDTRGDRGPPAPDEHV